MSKFTWRIENFSKLDAKKLFSVAFIVNDYQWRLSLYPKGNNADRHLSLYLGVVHSSALPDDWSIKAKFSLALINQIDRNKTIKKGLECMFFDLSRDFGVLNSILRVVLLRRRLAILELKIWRWIVQTKSISIVNQIDPNKTIKKECECYFDTLVYSKGWQFIELRKFNDRSGGYLVEDTCLVEAAFDVSPSDNDSDSPVAIDPVYIEAQSFLESLPKAPSTCGRPLLEGYAKEIFDKLISYRLDDLADPKNESAMMEFISVLANNISVFSDVQAREIVNLKATFPQTMQEWRDSMSQAKGTSEPSWSLFEETKSVLQDLVKTEEGIKTKLEELHKKETELEAELEAIEGKSQMLKEERRRVSKQMKILCGLVEEMASVGEARNKTQRKRIKSFPQINEMNNKAQYTPKISTTTTNR
ncbi:unnamed protein product [Cuscuta campestris]|uniref:MATH domain-containing protein n=1 Tax=Cuscuta campestris TaxID=132261 RepID=A0A484N3S5_9ASTE|nr:unnamed protein product [Cuscuta campestris]